MDGETPKRLYSEVLASGVQQGCLNGSVAGKDNRLVKLIPLAAARRTEKSVEPKRMGSAAGEEKKQKKSNIHYSTKPTRKMKPRDSKMSGSTSQDAATRRVEKPLDQAEKEMKPRDSKMSGSTSQDAATRRVEKPLDQAEKEKNPRDSKTSGAKVNGADGKEKRRRKWKSYYHRINYTGERKKLMDLDFSGYTWKGAEPTELGKLQDSPLWSSAALQSAGLLEDAADTTLVGGSLQSAMPTTMECSEDPTLVGGSLQSAVPTMESTEDPTLIVDSLQSVVATTMECSEDPTLVGYSLQSAVPTTMERPEDPTLLGGSLHPVLSTKMECSGDLTFLDRISKLAHDSQSLFEKRSERPHYPQDCNDGNIDDINSQNVIKMLSDVIQDDEPIHVTHQEVSALLKSERGQTVSDPLLQTMHTRSENPPNPESSSMWDWSYPCKSFRPTPTVASPCQVVASSLEKESVAEACKDLLQNEVTVSRETQSCRTPEHEILGSGPQEQETTTQDVDDQWHVHPLTIKLKSERDIYKVRAEMAEQAKKSALIRVDQLQEALKEAANVQAARTNRRHVPRATGTPTSQTDRNTLKTSVHQHNVAKRYASSSIPYPFLPSIIPYPFLPSIIPEYPYLPPSPPENSFTSSDAAGSDQSSSDSQPNVPVHQNPVYQLFSPTSSGGTQSSSDSQPNAPFYQNPVYRRVSPTSSGGTQSSADSQPNAPFYQNPVYRSVSPTSSGGTQSCADSQPNATVHQNPVYRPFSPNHQNQIYTVTNSYAPVNAETTSGETTSSGGAQSSSDSQPRAPAVMGTVHVLCPMFP